MADLSEGNPAGVVARSPEAIAQASPRLIAEHLSTEGIAETLRVWQEVIADLHLQLETEVGNRDHWHRMYLQAMKESSIAHNKIVAVRTVLDGLMDG